MFEPSSRFQGDPNILAKSARVFKAVCNEDRCGLFWVALAGDVGTARNVVTDELARKYAETDCVGMKTEDDHCDFYMACDLRREYADNPSTYLSLDRKIPPRIPTSSI